MDKIATSQELQTELRRLLACCQEANPSREKLASELRVLADKVGSSERQASYSGHYNLMALLGGESQVMAAYDMMDKDEQSKKLFGEVIRKMSKELELSSGAEEAFSRVFQIVSRGKSWDIDLIRNNVFKAAHSLGIKLPSGMF
jgi:hypothetical protein